MSILIKGMKMPKECAKCRLLEGDTMDGLCHGAEKWLDDDYFRWGLYAEGDIDDSKPLNCPLVEIPTPHGRLIDADAKIEKQIYNEMTQEWSVKTITVDDYLAFGAGLQATIIEAEEGVEE